MIRIVSVVAALCTLACSWTPPASEGLHIAQGGDYLKLERLAYKEITRKFLKPAIIEKFNRVEDTKRIALKGQMPRQAYWVVPEHAQSQEYKAPENSQAKIVEHGEAENVYALEFENLPEEGVVFIRVEGGNISGWYPIVLDDSEGWATWEAQSYFKAEKWDQAVQRLNDSIDYRKTADKYRMLARASSALKQSKDAISAAEKARDLAKDEKKDPIEYGVLVAEMYMLSGEYQDGLEVLRELQRAFPVDKKLLRLSGKLLEGVKPSPEELVKEIHDVSLRGGVDALEEYVLKADREESKLRKAASLLNKFGAVKDLKIIKVQRKGMSATVAYQVRFQKGPKYDRRMRFFLNDSGRYMLSLD